MSGWGFSTRPSGRTPGPLPLTPKSPSMASASARKRAMISGCASGAGLSIGGTNGVQILGNSIGTDVTGEVIVPNGRGIELIQTTGTRVGGGSPGEGNVVSGATGEGILIMGGSDIAIQGNRMGTDATGTKALGSDYAAIVAGIDGLRIRRIDPHIVNIAMHAFESADRAEALAGVIADYQGPVGLEQSIGIFRIHDQIREIERPPYHPRTFVTLLPGRAAIIGDVERAVGRFDERIYAVRLAGRDGEGNAAEGFVREAGIA